MRIYTSVNNVSSQGVVNSPPKVGGESTAGQSGASDVAQTGVSVSLSQKALELASTAKPSFDQAKVTRIRNEINSGSYQVDAKAIAQKIVEQG
jgi:flagellar biosynthesis anti-sigma factor FlgM